MRPEEEEAVAELVDFLEVCVHGLLHARGVYPAAIFERRRKYDLPVFMSRHPDLNLYVREVLQAAAGMLREGSIDKLVLCLYGPAAEPVESVCFELGDSAALVRELAGLPTTTSTGGGASSAAAASSGGGGDAMAASGVAAGVLDPYPAFRKVLSRLSVCEEVAELAPVPEDVTFALLLSTKKKPAAGGAVPEAWAAAVSSGEFAPSADPNDCYLATSSAESAQAGISYLNLVNWDWSLPATADMAMRQQQQQQQQQKGGAGGRQHQHQHHMRVVVRSKLTRVNANAAAAAAMAGGGGGGN